MDNYDTEMTLSANRLPFGVDRETLQQYLHDVAREEAQAQLEYNLGLSPSYLR